MLEISYHINYVSMKVSKIVGIIAKARHYLELKNLNELYNTMVYPYLTYCNINWASTYPTRLRSIYIAQRKLVRLMTFSSFRETFQPLFKLLKIMNIYEINLYLIANFMYLHYYGKHPETFDNYFVKMILYTPIVLGQLQKYTLNLKEQIMENFLFSIEEQ